MLRKFNLYVSYGYFYFETEGVPWGWSLKKSTNILYKQKYKITYPEISPIEMHLNMNM